MRQNLNGIFKAYKIYAKIFSILHFANFAKIFILPTMAHNDRMTASQASQLPSGERRQQTRRKKKTKKKTYNNIYITNKKINIYVCMQNEGTDKHKSPLKSENIEILKEGLEDE